MRLLAKTQIKEKRQAAIETDIRVANKARTYIKKELDKLNTFSEEQKEIRDKAINRTQTVLKDLEEQILSEESKLAVIKQKSEAVAGKIKKREKNCTIREEKIQQQVNSLVAREKEIEKQVEELTNREQHIFNKELQVERAEQRIVFLTEYNKQLSASLAETQINLDEQRQSQMEMDIQNNDKHKKAFLEVEIKSKQLDAEYAIIQEKKQQLDNLINRNLVKKRRLDMYLRKYGN